MATAFIIQYKQIKNLVDQQVPVSEIARITGIKERIVADRVREMVKKPPVESKPVIQKPKKVYKKRIRNPRVHISKRKERDITKLIKHKRAIFLDEPLSISQEKPNEVFQRPKAEYTNIPSRYGIAAEFLNQKM